ncbi:MAG: P-II family nitrogen regulator [Clostridia bacterium]|nr:P-II family nitrogen regulator [Clostridia bacterium]
MELYVVLTILDRDKRAVQEKIYKSLGLTAALSVLGRGTATQEHLSMRGLSPTPKAVMAAVAEKDTAKKLVKQTKVELYIDIPGNGVMAAILIKSVGGTQTLEYLTGGQPVNQVKPEMKFNHELICVILNEGHSDEVMDAARSAGATGGTVISAKGSGIMQIEKFRELSLANEREVLLIVAKAALKADIMRAIAEKTGLETDAGAICFSVPVSHVAGLRRIDEE